MTDTINNGIPLVPENVIDPAAGLNESLLIIDRLLQLKVIAVKQNTPAVGSTAGGRYIVGTSPTGAWAGKALQVAEWMPGGYWGFSPASVAVYGTSIYINTGTDWVPASAGAGASWGGITGSLGDQSDLAAALAGKESELIAGANITIDRSDPGAPVISSSGGGGGGGAEWGDITGDISDQVDLASALSEKEYELIAGSNITIDRTNPLAPIISSTGGGGGDVSTVAGVAPVSGDIPAAGLAAALDVPTTPSDIGAATAAQGTLADTAVQPDELTDALDEKVDKIDGYGLSQANYTQAEKDKLAGLDSGKFQGLFVSLAALAAAVPVGSPGFYAHIDPGAGSPPSVAIWDDSDSEWVEQAGSGGEMTPAQVKASYESNADTNPFDDAAKNKLAGIAAGAQVNVATNIAEGTRTATAVPLTSSTGTGASLSAASQTLAGVMTAADKAKLDGVAAGAQVNTVTSVAGKTGVVTLVKADVGLSSVDNTSDASKPVSTAQQTALDEKQDRLTSGANLKTINGVSLLGEGDVVIEGGDGKLSAINPVIEGSITEEVFALTGTAPVLEPGNGTIQTWTLTGNSTPTDSLSSGQSMTVMINDGTAYTITWPSVAWAGGSAPELAASGQTVVELWKVGTVLYGALVGSVA